MNSARSAGSPQMNAIVSRSPARSAVGRSGPGPRNADEPCDQERGERERGHGHPQRDADPEAGDQQAGDRSPEQVPDVLRRGEHRVRAFAPVPPGLRRGRHQALARGRAGRVSQRADDGQQDDLPDLQRVDREEDRQRCDREPAEQIGGCARANRADRVHDPTGRQATDGGAPDAGEDRNPGECGASCRGEDQPWDRDRRDDIPAQRYRVCQHQEGQRGKEPGPRRRGSGMAGDVGHATNDRAATGQNPLGSWPAPHRSFGR